MSNGRVLEGTRALASFTAECERRAASVAVVTKQASKQAKRTTTQARRQTAIIICSHLPPRAPHPYP